MRHRLVSFITTLLVAFALTAPALAAGSGSKAPKKTKSEQARDKYVAGQEAERKGEFQSAARSYQAAVTLDPKYAEAYNQLGYVRRQLGLYDKAIAAYKTALTLKPDFAEAHEYIARAYLAQDDIENAKAHHGTLVELNETLAEDLGRAIAEAEAAAHS